MNAFLLHENRDLDTQRPLPWNAQTLTADLALDVLFRAMGGDDEFLVEVARRVLLIAPENDVGTIFYRQEVLKDCLGNESAFREFYGLVVDADEQHRKHHWFGVLSKYPSSVLYDSLEHMEVYTRFLQALAAMARRHATRFTSGPVTRLFAMLQRELGDEYLDRIRTHLRELRFRDGVLLSASLGEGNEGTGYRLRKRVDAPRTVLERIVAGLRDILPGRGATHVVRIAERDQAGAHALSELRDRGISSPANALAQSVEHIQRFFRMLRTELAFYVGCLNLYIALGSNAVPVCFPTTGDPGRRTLRFRGLLDITLALTMDHRRVVGNTLDLDGKSAVVITGANQGGKSTFLRSLGLAQLMTQAGMFVAAESFVTEPCGALFTHYRREEDVAMESGKLDEELRRMAEIADRMAPGSTLLFNESFAATNDREGSEIARQVVTALVEKGQKVFYVTHLYPFAHGLHEASVGGAALLRAEREPDGTRTFRIVPGAPLETSYGEDVFHQVFGGSAEGTTGSTRELGAATHPVRESM